MRSLKRNHQFLSLLFLIAFTLQVQAQNYCTSKADRPWEEWIAGVQLADLDNASSKAKDYSNAGYSNYTNQTANLTTGQDYTITLTPGFSGGSANLGWRVSIDFNQDGDFEDAGERLLNQMGGQNTLTPTITIPVTASTGATRMRVQAMQGNIPATACTNFARGEVEDYTLNLISGNTGGDDKIDLELSLSASNILPGIYKNVSITTTIQNTSDTDASDIKVSLSACSATSTTPTIFNNRVGIVYANTNSIVSTGSYDNLVQSWSIPRLAAGASATLTVNLYTLSNEYINLLATVRSAKEEDVDSTPNEGAFSACVATEDDEAFLRLNEFEDNVDLPDLTITNLRVANTGEANTVVPYQIDLSNIGLADASEDFRLGVYLSNNATLDGNDIEIGEIPTGNFHAGLVIREVNGNFDLAGIVAGNYFLIFEIDTDKNITESDEQNNSISQAFRVNGNTPPTTNFVCEDNILRNNGFENGLDFWNVTQGNAQISSDARTGNSALQLCGGNGRSNLLTNIPIVDGAAAYSLFFYAKVDNPGEYETIYQNSVQLFFFNSSWQRVAGGTSNGTYPSTQIKASTEYALHSITRLVPEDAAYVGVEITRNWEGCMYLDDFCLIPERTSPDCAINLEVVSLNCDDNETPLNQLDDKYTFDYRVTATNASTGGYTLSYPIRVNQNGYQVGQYGQIYTSEPIQIGVDFDIDVTIKDLANLTCEDTFTIEKPEACSEALACDIDFELSVSDCNDNGTPSDDSDDTFTLTILATGINTSGTWKTTNFYNREFRGAYNTPVEIGPFLLENFTPYTYVSIRDVNDSSCNASQNFELPLPCVVVNTNVCDENLLQNGNFEQGLSNWTVLDFEYRPDRIIPSIVNPATSFDGSQAIEVCTNVQDALFTSAIYQDIPLTDNFQAFELSYDGIFSDRGGLTIIGVQFYDATGTFLPGGDYVNSGIGTTWSSNRRTVKFAPEGAVTMRVFFGASGGGDYGDACIIYDNLCLQKLGNEFERIDCENNLLNNNWTTRNTDVGVIYGAPVFNPSPARIGANGSYSQAVQAFEGQVFELNFYANFRSAAARVYLDFLDENGNLLAVSSINDNQGLWDGYTLQSEPAPVGTTQIQVRARNDMWFQAACLNRIGGLATDVDLQIEAVEVPFSVRMNETFQYDLSLVNAGTASAVGTYDIEVYISNSSYFNSTSATHIETISTSDTPVGTTHLQGFLTIPTLDRAGRMYLHFRIDEANVIAELDETNNGFAQELGVTASGIPFCNNRSYSPWEEWISYIKIGNTENLTGKAEYSAFYYNPLIEAQKGVSIPIQLRTTYSYFTYPEHWRIWIDLNQDRTYTDNEIVYQGILQPPAVGSGVSKTLYDNITIPNSALNGQTQLRIIMSRTGFEDPCGIIEYGEIEDYFINISGSNQPFGIAQNEVVPPLHLYPNPTRNALQVVLEAASTKTDMIRVFNAQGTLQLERTFEVSKGKNLFELEVSNLAAGVYFLTTAEGQQARFVKIE